MSLGKHTPPIFKRNRRPQALPPPLWCAREFPPLAYEPRCTQDTQQTPMQPTHFTMRYLGLHDHPTVNQTEGSQLVSQPFLMVSMETLPPTVKDSGQFLFSATNIHPFFQETSQTQPTITTTTSVVVLSYPFQMVS